MKQRRSARSVFAPQRQPRWIEGADNLQQYTPRQFLRPATLRAAHLVRVVGNPPLVTAVDAAHTACRQLGAPDKSEGGRLRCQVAVCPGRPQAERVKPARARVA